jgi:hypothetical protein
MSLNSRVKELEDTILRLQAKVDDLSRNTEEKNKQPHSVVGGLINKSLTNPYDIKSGQGFKGGTVFWNDTEIGHQVGTQPNAPSRGYHKHSHSRYFGGALIKDVVEIVEYDWGAIPANQRHSLQFITDLSIVKEKNSDDELVDKIGTLDLVFNPDTQKWGCPAYELDVKKCYLVERTATGAIATDSKGQQKKSLLYNADTNLTSVIWDENGRCWRFLAVYSPA